ncbi:MAG: LTA synthase family protein [Gammaproteobacteria bacterium]|nr:LTA synthase family protein [Gammaproteobacteria bacterium]
MPYYLRLFLLPLLLLLLVSQIEKGIFVLFHAAEFRDLGLADTLLAIVWGIRFDLAIAGLLAFLALFAAYLLQRLLGRRLHIGLRHTSFIAAATLLLLHGADMLYYGEAGRHLGYELKEGFNSGADLATAALQGYTLPVVLQLLLLIPLYFANRLLFDHLAPHRAEESPTPRRSHFPHTELALLLTLLLSAVMVRGGVGSVPLEPLHAQEIGDSRRAAIALNGPYNAVFSSITPYSIRPVFAGEPGERALAEVRNMFTHTRTGATGAARPYNVIMLLLESWSGAFQQPYGYNQQTTPFFDGLRQRSLTTLAMTAGGHRTTEGIFATMCSWQNPLGQTVAQSQLQNYEYRCLPELLNEQGYHSAFFQGTLKNTSGTGAFAQLLGFRHSYGKEDVAEYRYPHNSWGLQDPDLYRFVLQRLKQMPQPFFVGINSNSTHSSELPPGTPPHFSGQGAETTYLNMLHFSDAALGEFIQAVASDPAFARTIFVVVADHAGPSLGKSHLNRYLVPFLIHAPGLVEPRQLDIVSSQRDIAPTLLDLLNIDTEANFSGSSLLTDHQNHHADYYHQGVLGWVEGRRGLEVRLGEEREMQCYNLLSGPLRQQPDACDAHDETRLSRALAFTHLNQSLLFNGKIGTFSQLLQKPGAQHATGTP